MTKSSVKKIWQLNFLRKKLFHVKEKVFYVLNYLNTFKAVHKNNPQTQSSQQKKKAVLTTAAYFKVTGHRGNNCSSFTFVYRKRCFRSKTEKENIAIEFCMFELVWIPNFSLNWQFWFFRLNLPKKGVSGLKHKKWIQPFSSAYLN